MDYLETIKKTLEGKLGVKIVLVTGHMEEKKPEPLYKEGDKVVIKDAVKVVIQQAGWRRENGKWVPSYYCVRMNKDGSPDKRELISSWRRLHTSETSMKPFTGK